MAQHSHLRKIAKSSDFEIYVCNFVAVTVTGGTMESDLSQPLTNVSPDTNMRTGGGAVTKIIRFENIYFSSLFNFLNSSLMIYLLQVMNAIMSI